MFTLSNSVNKKAPARIPKLHWQISFDFIPLSLLFLLIFHRGFFGAGALSVPFFLEPPALRVFFAAALASSFPLP